MIPLTLAEIAAITGGAVDGPAGSDTVTVTAEAFLDSRQPVRGGLFVAVAGERVDGHDFAPDAIGRGAGGVLAQRPVGVPAVVVPDSVAALGVLARHLVTRLRGLTVVGITGSQGKTSTKDVAAQLVEHVGSTVAPVGSFNNELGVPLTALRCTPETRFLVCEMGARGHGHISYLTSLVSPSVGVVVNVGVAHLGEFGSREAIASAKGELIASLPDDGLAVLNEDDPLVRGMRARTNAAVSTFGMAEVSDIRVSDVRLDPRGHVNAVFSHRGQRNDVTIPLVGAHNATNAAAAIAVALRCGMSFADACAALASVTVRSRWRMEVSSGPQGLLIINDAYNANPDSMRAGLTTLAELGTGRPGSRTFAVLGEMLELGATSADEHASIGRFTASLGISDLVVVGDGARSIEVGASAEHDAGRWSGTPTRVADPAAAVEFLRRSTRAGDVVLVKASRAVGLEKVALALLDPGADSRR